MRCIFIYILLFFFFFTIFASTAQEEGKGFEIEFSSIHAVSQVEEGDYHYYGLDYTLDPTLKLLYNFTVIPNVDISSGIYLQYGEHNWEELLRKTMQYPNGIWYPSRTIWSRQLRFFSVGIPLEAELKFNSFLFNSVFAGAAAGNHLYLNLKERMENSEGEYSEAGPPDYRWYFWDLYFGIRKTIVRSPALNLAVKPQVGYKNNRPDRIPGKSNYFYYGLGISTTF